MMNRGRFLTVSIRLPISSLLIYQSLQPVNVSSNDQHFKLIYFYILSVSTLFHFQEQLERQTDCSIGSCSKVSDQSETDYGCDISINVLLSLFLSQLIFINNLK